MKAKLAKLINVKSIITLVLTGVFAYLSITGRIVEDNFMDMFQIILIFYFGTQSGKAEATAKSDV
jgi:isochorismate hydrolase